MPGTNVCDTTAVDAVRRSDRRYDRSRPCSQSWHPFLTKDDTATRVPRPCSMATFPPPLHRPRAIYPPPGRCNNDATVVGEDIEAPGLKHVAQHGYSWRRRIHRCQTTNQSLTG